MQALLPTPQRALQIAWPMFKKLPKGGTFLGKVISRFVPYAGNVHPQIISLEPGHAVVAMQDGPDVRNHLRSLHAMALGNLAEFSSAVGIMYGLPDDMRAILTHIELDYIRKARGRVVADARAQTPLAEGPCDVIISITNADNQEVVRALAKWKISQGKA